MSLYFPPPCSHLPPPALPRLSSVYLEPLSARSAAAAKANPDDILNLLAARGLLRSGDVLTTPDSSSNVDSSSNTYCGSGDGRLWAYRVVLTEPSLGGRYVPEDDDDDADQDQGASPTEVILGSLGFDTEDRGAAANGYGQPAEEPVQRPVSSLSHASSSSSSDRTIQPPGNATFASSHHPSSDSGDDSDSEEFDFEISASFLQTALLPPSGSALPTASTPSTSVAFNFTPTTLDRPLSLPPPPPSANGKVDSGMIRSVDMEMVAWTRPKGLGEIGAFDGDWVAITAAEDAAEHSDWRLVKLYALDDPSVPHVASQPNNQLHIPPLLHHNISPLTPPSTLKILPTPFPPSSVAPLPTATSVTLARLASPAATSKLVQSSVLHALRRYLEGFRGGLKVGDLLGVGVDEFVDESDVQNDVSLEPPAPSLVRPTTAVFFVVSHIELPPPNVINSNRSKPDSWDVRAARGDFGCYIDPASTTLVQAGLKHGPGVGGSFPSWVGISLLPSPLNSKANTSAFPGATLRDIITSSLAPGMAAFDLQASFLLKGARGSGKRTLARSVAGRLGLGVMEVSCFDIAGETDAKTEGVLRARFERAAGCSPCMLLLRHVEALARKGQVLETGKEPQIAGVLRECIESLSETWKASGYPIIVVGTTSDPDRVPLGILACFKQELSIEAPDETARLEILQNVLSDTVLASDVDVKAIAVQTAALVADNLVSLVERAKGAAIRRVQASALVSEVSLVSFAYSGVALTAADFSRALETARSAYSESIGAPKIPNVTWDDVGGLASVKTDILDTIELPLSRPELFAKGLKKRSGILLYGPPGTGKTLLAKAVATSCSLNFFSVKGPELLNMYIGESEANVRRVFQRARDAKPCVIFFDELDSVAPKRGNQGDSGGVMDRIVSQLLAELDGMSDSEGKGSADVFVIGATNRPDLLDPALLRPGRFDRMLYLGLSETHEAQRTILEALTRKFKLNPNLSLADVAERCPFHYTGADLYALCSDAMLNAMSRKAAEIDARIAELNAQPPPPNNVHPYPLTPPYYLSELATADEMAVLVGADDFGRALDTLVPSVSAAELEHYRKIQSQFQQKPKAKLAPVQAQAQAQEELVNGSYVGGVLEAESPASLSSYKGKGKARAE